MPVEGAAVESSILEDLCRELGPHLVGLKDENGKTINSAPGENCGETFSNEVFALRDFCWCSGAVHPEDEEGRATCPPNFEHFPSGVKGEWYKRLGRGTYFTEDIGEEEAAAILASCLRSLGIAAPMEAKAEEQPAVDPADQALLDRIKAMPRYGEAASTADLASVMERLEKITMDINAIKNSIDGPGPVETQVFDSIRHSLSIAASLTKVAQRLLPGR